MFFRKRNSVIGIGIMLVLMTFSVAVTNVSATELIAEAGGPYVFDECEVVPFDASGSSGDPPLQYRWMFNGDWTNWSTNPAYGYLWRNDFHGFILLYLFARLKRNFFHPQAISPITSIK